MIKKGAMSLSISTIVLFVLGIFVLMGLIFLVSSGFNKFDEDTGDVIDSLDYKKAKAECLNYCFDRNPEYCCKEFDISENKYVCEDIVLDECSFDCEGVVCNG